MLQQDALYDLFYRSARAVRTVSLATGETRVCTQPLRRGQRPTTVAPYPLDATPSGCPTNTFTRHAARAHSAIGLCRIVLHAASFYTARPMPLRMSACKTRPQSFVHCSRRCKLWHAAGECRAFAGRAFILPTRHTRTHSTILHCPIADAHVPLFKDPDGCGFMDQARV